MFIYNKLLLNLGLIPIYNVNSRKWLLCFPETLTKNGILGSHGSGDRVASFSGVEENPVFIPAFIDQYPNPSLVLCRVWSNFVRISVKHEYLIILIQSNYPICKNMLLSLQDFILSQSLSLENMKHSSESTLHIGIKYSILVSKIFPYPTTFCSPQVSLNFW